MKTQAHTISQNAGTIDELEAKVRACNTYHHGYFVMFTKIRKQGNTWEIVDRLVMSDPQSQNQCEMDKQKYEAQIATYGRRRGMKTTISIHNIFERYDLWKAAQGEEQPRAAQWEAIKKAARA